MAIEIENLITDRTLADVERVQTLAAKGWAGMTETEQSEWQSGMKGAYNATDFNRVGAAVAYIAGQLKGMGYIASVTAKQDWQITDKPTPEQTKTYLNDVRTVKKALPLQTDTPSAPPDMEQFSWQEANDIEQILVIVDGQITRIKKSQFYCGEPFCGEV